MKVELVKDDFVKGIALVVGKPKGEEFETDLTVLHTAHCVSDTPYYIDNEVLNLGSPLDNTVIYICGHGSRERQTIGRRSMRELARILVEDRKYRGKQNIYVTSCESAHELVESLKLEITDKLKLMKPESESCFDFKVESRTPDGSITIDDSGIIKQYSVISENDKDSMYIKCVNMMYKFEGSRKIRYSSASSISIEADKMSQTNKHKVYLINRLRRKGTVWGDGDDELIDGARKVVITLVAILGLAAGYRLHTNGLQFDAQITILTAVMITAYLDKVFDRLVTLILMTFTFALALSNLAFLLL